jgi:hypothetical protein
VRRPFAEETVQPISDYLWRYWFRADQLSSLLQVKERQLGCKPETVTHWILLSLDRNSLFEHLLQTAKAFVIVCFAFHDHLMSFTSDVDMRDLADYGRSRHLNV